MGYINLPPDVRSIIENLKGRLDKLETGKRFTMPSVSSSPTPARNGDIWLDTTANVPKYVDNNGAVIAFGTGTITSIDGGSA